MTNFFTVLSWIFLVIAIIRIIGIYYGAKENKHLIQAVNAYGEYPIQAALRIPLITIIVCLAWIFTQ